MIIGLVKMLRLVLLVGLLALAAPLHAGSRTSGSYVIATDSADAGGKRTSSASYMNDGSIGGVAGTSAVASPVEASKSGYIGQLYDITGLTLTAATLNVNEGATDLLGARQALDDDTFLALPAANVAWSVQSGPLTGISASGLATAGIVFQDTAATARGIYLGNTGTLALTVKNVNLDNFGSYAGDGLDDAWQILHFGLDNPNAAPQLDPDGDGETNAFEFTAGLIPTDPSSRFRLQVAPGSAPATLSLIFSPRLADRTYVVSFKTDLASPTWSPLTGATMIDSGLQRTVTDTGATGTKKFYHVEITKP